MFSVRRVSYFSPCLSTALNVCFFPPPPSSLFSFFAANPSVSFYRYVALPIILRKRLTRCFEIVLAMSQSGLSAAAAPYNPVPLDDTPGTPRNASFMDSPRGSPPHTPIPPENGRFLGHDPAASARDSYASSTPYNQDNSSGQFLNDDDHASRPKSEALGYTSVNEKGAGSSPAKRKRTLILGLSALAVVILIIVIVVPVTVLKKKNNDGSGSGSSNGSDGQGGENGGSDGGNGKPGVHVAVTGGDGSEVTLEDGSKFTYKNPHGGHWYYDANDPFNNGARAQSWSPALNETFRYGIDKIRG